MMTEAAAPVPMTTMSAGLSHFEGVCPGEEVQLVSRPLLLPMTATPRPHHFQEIAP